MIYLSKFCSCKNRQKLTLANAKKLSLVFNSDRLYSKYVARDILENVRMMFITSRPN
ncbi:hypothetical protein P689_11916 [Candidatus Riesia pediculischaeffi PTSU]|uniref:Uncharacterized protein n=1 Tax=Candidatus Riesia pediculischaeffi PTSU TaxID=1401651 RepID=A0A0C1VJK5_9ENTR|nr:hypothetical protein P689_11916 [Candidatus Riesia pediculischaeffi PTSU]